MNRASVVLASMLLACDPASKEAGDVTVEGLTNAQAAAAACRARLSCCDDAPPDVSDCDFALLWLLDHQSQVAARYDLDRDASCFDNLGRCGPTMAEQAVSCEPPCKLFVGSAGLHEPCDIVESNTWIDTCAQGLMCVRISEDESGLDGQCVDPCAEGRVDAECTVANESLTCGPSAYCDGDPFADVPGRCRVRFVLGEPCDPERDSCVAEAFCDPQAESGPTCVPVLEEGQPCVGDRTCRSRRCGDEAYDPDVQEGLCEPTLTDWCYEGGNPGDVLIPIFP